MPDTQDTLEDMPDREPLVINKVTGVLSEAHQPTDTLPEIGHTDMLDEMEITARSILERKDKDGHTEYVVVWSIL